MIKIERKSALVDRLQAYKVVLDGNIVGEINNGEQIEIDAPLGKHSLQLKLEEYTSNSVDFEIDGSLVEFECFSRFKGFPVWGWALLLNLTFFRNQYITLIQK